MNVEEAKKKKDCHLVCWVNGEDPWIGESGVTRMSVCWKGGNGQRERVKIIIFVIGIIMTVIIE